MKYINWQIKKIYEQHLSPHCIL